MPYKHARATRRGPTPGPSLGFVRLQSYLKERPHVGSVKLDHGEVDDGVDGSHGQSHDGQSAGQGCQIRAGRDQRQGHRHQEHGRQQDAVFREPVSRFSVTVQSLIYSSYGIYSSTTDSLYLYCIRKTPRLTRRQVHSLGVEKKSDKLGYLSADFC